MPALGAGMDVGKIIEWYVSPGDEVHRGGVIAKVETDKANIDVEVFQNGVVEELLVSPGTKVPVGAPLARIGTGAEVVRAEEPSAPSRTERDGAVALEVHREVEGELAREIEIEIATDRDVDERPFVLSPLVRRQARTLGVDLRRVRGTGPGGVITRGDVAAAGSRVRSSPYARRLAAERGIELRTLRGSGPGGVVVLRDLPAGAAAEEDRAPADRAAATADERGAVRPPAGEAGEGGTEDRGLAMRLAIARAMERSNREIPHYYLGETVDAEPLLRWLAEVNEELPPPDRLLPAAVVLKAVAQALVKYPDLNGYWIDGAYQPGEGIHLGVAINLRAGGLLAPAIRDVDQLPLSEVMAALKDLVERTRSGGLKGSELTDPTITISNLGDTGVESILGVITPPQVALVGVGRITERPWAIDGMLTVHRTVFLSLAGDHRASDGHRGGRFLAAIAKNLTRPEKL